MIVVAVALVMAVATAAFIGMRPSGLREAAMALMPLNAAADVVVTFGSDGAVHMGQVRAVIAAVTILAVLPKLRLSRASGIVFSLLALLSPLALLSSNPTFSANVYMKFALALLMFPLGAHVVRSVDDLRRLHTAIMV